MFCCVNRDCLPSQLATFDCDTSFSLVLGFDGLVHVVAEFVPPVGCLKSGDVASSFSIVVVPMRVSGEIVSYVEELALGADERMLITIWFTLLVGILAPAGVRLIGVVKLSPAA